MSIATRVTASRLRILLIGGGAEGAERIGSALADSSSTHFDLAHAPSLAAAIEVPDVKESDVFLLDVSGAAGDELARLARARSRFPAIPIVVLADRDDEALAVECIHGGARGYILKSELSSRLLVTTLAAAVGIHRAILQLSEARERERHLVTHDQLTGLANRVLFNDRLAQAVAVARRGQGKFAVLFLNLDGFKAINDQMGHAVGDGLLKGIARQITACLRDSDTAARFSADEFAVIVTQMGDEFVAVNVADKILRAVRKPQLFSPQASPTTVSIGVATFPRDGSDGEELLQKADLAMEHAKKAGGDRIEFYTREMNKAVVKRRLLESGLRAALENDQFELFYQPQMDVRSARITGGEGLLRWRHPESGLVGPGEFLPLAEETGLIVPIGEWVLREGCRQSAVWREMGHRVGRISVNVASQQFHQPDFADLVRSAIEEAGIAPAALELEITESSLIQDLDATMTMLQTLKELGVFLAIDDFGTGYSSLAYLKRLPVDVLKIDQSFVRAIATSPTDATITATIVKLAQGLGLATVAEGVETPEQLLLLASYGCNRMQGYLVGKPVPADTFVEWVVDPPFRWMRGEDAPES
jgi:diguanylate cyclase (GGDEF)-like protein